MSDDLRDAILTLLIIFGVATIVMGTIFLIETDSRQRQERCWEEWRTFNCPTPTVIEFRVK